MRGLAYPLLALVALAGCAAEPSATGAFANRAAVSHPQALFDVAPRSDLLRRNDGRTGQPRGERVCPRADDLRELAPLTQASLAALRGSAEATQAPREFARALNVSAYRLLLDLDMARAARDVAALRAHADTNAWLGAEAKGSSAGSVIDGMGPTLPAWQILRQSAAATDGGPAGDRRLAGAARPLRRGARRAEQHRDVPGRELDAARADARRRGDVPQGRRQRLLCPARGHAAGRELSHGGRPRPDGAREPEPEHRAPGLFGADRREPWGRPLPRRR